MPSGTKLFPNVLYVLEISYKGQLLDGGMLSSFHSQLCEIFYKKEEKQMAVKMRDHSFPLKWETTMTTTLDESILRHKRFGHCN